VRGAGLAERYRVEVIEAMPAHAGFGSGTQLAIGIGAALARLEGRDATARDLAMIVERGARSAIGLAAFEQGGFVVDGGRAPGLAPPPVVARHPFPEDWRVLLVLDPSVRGLQGDAEKAAFGGLPRLSDAASGELCRTMLLRVLPGLVERDLAAFGPACRGCRSCWATISPRRARAAGQARRSDARLIGSAGR
jgi:beta-RFAP synthase